MADPTPNVNGAAPVAPPPAPGTPEYDQKMVALAETRMGLEPTTPATPVKAERPADVPEKFWDAEKGVVRVEDVLKAHRELESKLGAKPPAEAAKPAAPAPVKEATLDEQKAFLKEKGVDPAALDEAAIKAKYIELNPPPAAEAQKVVEKAGLDFDALASEYTEKGALSPETYEKLEKAGIPKATVDAYVAGQQALAEKYDAAAFETAGDKAAYEELVNWAKGALTPGESKAFNDAVISGDLDRMKLAVSGLRDRYVAANGQRPNLVKGGRPNDTGQGYNSRAEMVADMKKIEYKKDPAFRAKVEARVAATTAF